MSQLRDEIDKNHSTFFVDWTTAHDNNLAALKENLVFRESYRRLSVLQTLKVHIIVPHYTPESAEFFFEAHNDTLVSHISAASGAWRSALQSLRSSIENTLCSIYYNEHPVEHELWRKGKFIISSSELFKYVEKHPKFSELPSSANGIETLKDEYATLSKAVHASAVNFRMTDAVSNILLWSADPIKASQWSTREKRVVAGLCMLLVTKHRDMLQGTKLAPVRDMLGFAISNTDKRKLKSVTINVP